MSTGPQKPRKSGRISDLLKRRRDTPAFGEQPDTSGSQPQRYSDKERTRERYKHAISLLEDALKGRNEKWGNFEIPKLEGELENVNPAEFRGKLAALCETYSAKHDRNWVGKCAHAIECCFTAFAPFAKNFLAIARESAQVLPTACDKFCALPV
jgi:hypothetical protein